MKFSVNCGDLQRTLGKLGSVLPARSTMPILENILFDLKGNTLTLTATDLAVSMTVGMAVQGVEDGKIAIPAKRILDTVRSLTDQTVSFAIDITANRVTLTTSNGQYNLTAEPAKEYPQLPPFQAHAQITLTTESLRRIIQRTAFAVSTDELRPAMGGVLLQVKEDGLRAVSTDGHRLVRLIRRDLSGAQLKKDIIIPAKALTILGRSMDGASTELGVSDTHIRFVFDATTLISRLIEETYPNYESVIPSENDKILEVHRDEMITSIRRVALYASATTHQVRLTASAEALEVSAQDVDFGGEARETLKATYNASPLEIGFNSTYLLDILTHLDSERVRLSFSAPTRAALVSPVLQPEDEDVIMLVMPVRLNT
jgi:DNA polymerase III subunit beta